MLICAQDTHIYRLYGLTTVVVRLGGCKVKGMVAWVVGLMYVAVVGLVWLVYLIVRHFRIIISTYFLGDDFQNKNERHNRFQ